MIPHHASDLTYRKEKIIMLKTINHILKENNLAATECRANFKRKDGVITLTTTCHFQGKIISTIIPLAYKFFADCAFDAEKVTVSEEANESMIHLLSFFCKERSSARYNLL